MDDHGIILIGLPAFERVSEDGYLAGLGLLKKQQPSQECESEEESHRVSLII
jgi:hypothetical protein